MVPAGACQPTPKVRVRAQSQSRCFRNSKTRNDSYGDRNGGFRGYLYPSSLPQTDFNAIGTGCVLVPGDYYRCQDFIVLLISLTKDSSFGAINLLISKLCLDTHLLDTRFLQCHNLLSPCRRREHVGCLANSSVTMKKIPLSRRPETQVRALDRPAALPSQAS